MNLLLICRLLGWIAVLVGAAMVLSLPWAFPACGQAATFEGRGFFSIVGAMVISIAVGLLLVYVGRSSRGQALYRKEAMAVVGLSWLMATVLGALPFWFSGATTPGGSLVARAMDSLFESASGFTGTGATVIADLEDPEQVPRSVLFWRSETHFLGGLGIVVLFVAILGMGSAGKALMQTEMPGPSQESPHARMQRAAWAFTGIFVGLTLLLTFLLVVQGVSWFDGFCHAFGTIATGGFSTYNRSVEHFQDVRVEMTITLFMVLACTNFTLLYYLVLLKPGKLIGDIEFRTYLAILLGATTLVIGFGLGSGDFAGPGPAVRYGLFQVVSILTNTGFGTHDFDQWNSFSRALLLVLMFIGGCAGSTSCSVKVIRHILFVKILWLELEKVFRPSVVRPIRLGGKVVEAGDLRKDVLVYFGTILFIFVVAWILLVAVEPDRTWVEAGRSTQNKLVDCASAVAATLNGVGPGLGVVGESENYAHFHGPSKFVLIWMMLFGRLEVSVIVVLFIPRFWRAQ